MTKHNINISADEKNREYFKSFLSTRGGLGFLQISLAGLAIALVCLPITWNVTSIGYGMDPAKSKINLLIIGIAIFMLLTFLSISFRFSRQFLMKHQGLASLLGVIQSILLTFILMFSCYMFTQLDVPNEIWYESSFSIIVTIFFSLVYGGSLCYNFFWLKKQLQFGFSENRTVANYSAKSKVYESKSLWIIFGFSMLGAFLTGNIMKVFGLGFGALLGAAFSRLTIELGYAAYLLNKNKDYWIKYIDEPKKTWKEIVIKRLKRRSTYVIVAILLFGAIVTIEDRYVISETLHIIFSYIGLGLLIWLGVAFLWWMIEKLTYKKHGGKK